MYKNIIKKSFLGFMILFGLLFVNLGEVRAAPDSLTSSSSKPLYGDDKKSVNCSCYYTGEYVEEARVTYYAVEMVYGSNQKEVKSICETDERQNVFGAEKCKKVNHPTIGTPFEVDYKSIYNNNCSVEACNSANIYFYSSLFSSNNPNILTDVSKEIVTTGYNCDGGACVAIPLKAYSKEQYNKVVTADNMQEAMVEEGMVVDHFNSDGNNIDKIRCWADPTLDICKDYNITSPDYTCEVVDGKYYGKNGNEVDVKTYTEGCYKGSCDLIPSEILDFLKNFLFIIQIIGILLLIIMSFVEFIRALTGSDDEGLMKAVKNTGKRIIVVVILLLLPVIIVGILNMINNEGYQKDENGNLIIGEEGNPLCNLDK